ncbi:MULTISPECIES: NAD(P) transhydrogenase subunit alpha [Thalassospira]|jgi:NAD(P) transhydrogenase subunit alpha|uniref:proton-translocating NAD(P)(+) transhydrogenase n=1 Tax=Thalassospira povalilytica TaxID=732237 RepID=A0A8I1M7E2_9PROT|nr:MULTISPECIES: NAD(P) transhydrogenase subunit alpha [Thalassospira]MEE3047036.1 NAD(P) transhydrogenase subunit alpha [Pseudomonadota bacterium]RCK21878.1 NAD synthetase [Thalassospira profundimaris]KZB60090.1 NAD synthetase [Thalassospira sp. MCCC 1A02491]MAL41867.1 NAD synthetase [Thalassospira sp.]MBN8196364.1 NAD(P) transhydrogenase subunit alpha [Thalassospira povalilytica]|tara:strand:- start:1326 stop:1757 length:432 start_codon:yes stop_codon:yes gene_type:complete
MADQSVAQNANELRDAALGLAEKAAKLADSLASGATDAANTATVAVQGTGVSPTVLGLTVFVLACFVGYYVVWKVTPALHSPLMAVTNAISSVIIVGALLAAGPVEMNFSKMMGFIAVVLASVNIFGGFIVAQRMLHMFKKKK